MYYVKLSVEIKENEMLKLKNEDVRIMEFMILILD